MTKHILTIIFAGSLIVFSSDLKAQQADDNTPKLAASSKKASATTSTTVGNNAPKLAKVDIRSKAEQAELRKKKGTQAMSGDNTPRLVTTSRKKKK